MAVSDMVALYFEFGAVAQTCLADVLATISTRKISSTHAVAATSVPEGAQEAQELFRQIWHAAHHIEHMLVAGTSTPKPTTRPSMSKKFTRAPAMTNIPLAPSNAAAAAEETSDHIVVCTRAFRLQQLWITDRCSRSHPDKVVPRCARGDLCVVRRIMLQSGLLYTGQPLSVFLMPQQEYIFQSTGTLPTNAENMLCLLCLSTQLPAAMLDTSYRAPFANVSGPGEFAPRYLMQGPDGVTFVLPHLERLRVSSYVVGNGKIITYVDESYLSLDF